MEWKRLTIFCDGSCNWKSRKGGVGIYIQWDDKEYFISKGYENTTISRCELRAFLTAIESLDNSPILATVYSDSQYVVNGLTKYLWDWYYNEWKGCANVDLWKRVVDLLRQKKHLRLKIRWIRGHQKDVSDSIIFGNTVADLLANYKQFEEYEKDLND